MTLNGTSALSDSPEALHQHAHDIWRETQKVGTLNCHQMHMWIKQSVYTITLSAHHSHPFEGGTNRKEGSMPRDHHGMLWCSELNHAPS